MTAQGPRTACRRCLLISPGPSSPLSPNIPSLRSAILLSEAFTLSAATISLLLQAWPQGHPSASTSHLFIFLASPPPLSHHHTTPAHSCCSASGLATLVFTAAQYYVSRHIFKHTASFKSSQNCRVSRSSTPATSLRSPAWAAAAPAEACTPRTLFCGIVLMLRAGTEGS